MKKIINFLSAKKEIKQLAQKYKVGGKNYKEKIEKLLKKVYPIPPSLAIAQAAAESGWELQGSLKKETRYLVNGLMTE